MINEECLSQECSRIIAGILWNSWAGITTAADLEDGLQLGAVGMRMASGEHLHNETAERPDVGLACISSLPDDFRSHPKDRALERDTLVALLTAAQCGGFDALGDTEIGNLDGALVVDENVGTLDVSVDNVS